MAKQEQILKIEPAIELTFTGPFHQAVSSTMSLTNPSDRKVCFKIKTTAPKRYCVKPNSGVVDPRQAVQIAVSLQPFDFDPADKNRHKFMVQSMFAPAGEINQDSLWKEADSSQLMDSKLKCVFVLPETNGAPELGGGNRDSWQSAVVSGNGEGILSKDDNTHGSMPVQPPTAQPRQGEITSKTMSGDVDGNLERSVKEIKKLNEEVSSLRQENIQLKEEALRQKRLAASRGPSDTGYQTQSSTSQADPGSYTLHARNPDADSLSATYLYLAILVLIIGIIIGKFIF